MKHLRKRSSLLLALVLCTGLTAPAMAGNTTVYLDGYTSIQNAASHDVIGSLECTEEESQLSVTGELEKVGTLTEEGIGEDPDKDFTVSLYRSSKPVTVTLTAGVEENGSAATENGGRKLFVYSVGVNSVTYDSANKYYALDKVDAVYFQGNVGVENEDGTITTVGTIEQVETDEVVVKDSMPCIYKGATVTLSEPGIYCAYAFLEALEGGCIVYIEITGDAADTTETPVQTFTDVATTSKFYQGVQWAVENGITKGTGDGTTFAPKSTCTNNHILTFLWRANGSPEATVENPFDNINVTSDFGKAALWAYEQGLVTGTSFPGSTACTRAQTMVYFWKQAGSPETAVSDKFTDVSADADYAQAVAWAVANGITTGVTDTAFSPDATCTRGQIATFLYRARDVLSLTPAGE